ncbi:hypothetical protein [Pseudomonas syringae]|uniref:hypothetical protein n=1 Tax=Pseudomonas syringae TaxID=317 RepID=UPI000EFCE7CC|nr:hypothetical protein [Pseudomonas syringae]
MTNEEKRIALQDAAASVYDATLNDRPEKLMLKLHARDTIEKVLAGTVAECLTDELKNELVPLCQPFNESNFFLMTGLAGFVDRGDLAGAYKIRLLAADWGS